MAESSNYSLWEADGDEPRRVGGYDSLHDALALVPGLAAGKGAALVVNHNGTDSVRVCYESPALRQHPDHEAVLTGVAQQLEVSVEELRGRPVLDDLEAAPTTPEPVESPALGL